MFEFDFVRGPLHDIALAFMAVVYSIRVYWFTRFKAGKERQAPTGTGDAKGRRGFIYSWANIAMPWAMESNRQKFLLYLQFAIFHVGVAVAIALLFTISWYFGDEPLPPTLALVLQVILGTSFLIGVYRIFRRFINIYVRSISSPDDHFSLWLLTVWFGFAFFAAPNDLSGPIWPIYGYFLSGSFFLIYVPFSKISHYLYYPFTRFYLGKSLGRRGVYPMRKPQGS